MFVLMVPFSMDMLMAMHPGLMLMLVPVMAVGATLVAMLVLMLVLVVTTHRGLTSLVIHMFNCNHESLYRQGDFSPDLRPWPQAAFPAGPPPG